MNKTFILAILMTISLENYAQCLTERHSTSWYDGWASCSASQSPNPARGISHWIMYNFGVPYRLTTSTLWNSNDPAHLDYGLQGYTADYSTDGISWTSLGTFSAEKATGSPFYEGTEGPDFDEAIAQYVLITALSNYGGSCYGFSELKINLANTANGISDEMEAPVIVYPNPFTDKLNIRFFNAESEKFYSVTIHDLTGRIVYQTYKDLSTESNDILLDNQEMKLVSGIYTIDVNTNRSKKTLKIVKL